MNQCTIGLITLTKLRMRVNKLIWVVYTYRVLFASVCFVLGYFVVVVVSGHWCA